MINVKKLCDVFRFIDDLNGINEARLFESNFRDICVEELQVNRENSSNAEVTLLDLDIKIKNNKFQISLYD